MQSLNTTIQWLGMQDVAFEGFAGDDPELLVFQIFILEIHKTFGCAPDFYVSARYSTFNTLAYRPS